MPAFINPDLVPSPQRDPASAPGRFHRPNVWSHCPLPPSTPASVCSHAFADPTDLVSQTPTHGIHSSPIPSCANQCAKNSKFPPYGRCWVGQRLSGPRLRGFFPRQGLNRWTSSRRAPSWAETSSQHPQRPLRPPTLRVIVPQRAKRVPELGVLCFVRSRWASRRRPRLQRHGNR